MEEVVVIEVRIGDATRNELAAPIQDEVAPGENGRVTPSAADP